MIAGRLKLLGPKHEHTLLAKYNYAITLEFLKNYQASADLMREVHH